MGSSPRARPSMRTSCSTLCRKRASPTPVLRFSPAKIRKRRTPRCAPYSPTAHRKADLRSWTTLPNGLTLIVQSEDVSDTISVYGHIRNRPETEESPGREGVSQVLEALLPYGSEKLDRVAFESALDAIGARERPGVDFSVQTLAENFEQGVALLADNQ